MHVSELLAALQKVQQVAGDVPVVLKHVENGAESELLSLGIHIGASSPDQTGRVELEHGDAPPASEPEPESTPPPAA